MQVRECQKSSFIGCHCCGKVELNLLGPNHLQHLTFTRSRHKIGDFMTLWQEFFLCQTLAGYLFLDSTLAIYLFTNFAPSPWIITGPLLTSSVYKLPADNFCTVALKTAGVHCTGISTDLLFSQILLDVNNNVQVDGQQNNSKGSFHKVLYPN